MGISTNGFGIAQIQNQRRNAEKTVTLGSVELKKLFFILAKNEWTASPQNSAKSLEIQGFSAHAKPIKT